MKKTLLSIAVFLLVALSSSAQKDHVSDARFVFDSVLIHHKHWHTQTASEDTIKYASTYVWKYFKVENDTLYAVIPKGYQQYWVDDPMTGRLTNKEMVVVDREGNDGNSIIRSYFRTYDLVGQRVAICCVKKPAEVFLSL